MVRFTQSSSRALTSNPDPGRRPFTRRAPAISPGVAAGGAVAALLLLSAAARAQSFTTLHEFAGPPAGATPNGGLVQAADGNFYGLTQFGGVNDIGAIYRITPAGTVTVLHSFAGPEGQDPFGELIQATDGNFYGTTALGGPGGINGNGVVFRMVPDGTVTTLHLFNGADGFGPQTALLQGSDGNFYGTTSGGGANGQGTVFRVSPSGAFTLLHSFNGTDGALPLGSLIVGNDGNFYGTTDNGGTANGGTVYRITPAGVFTSLHSFTFAAGDGNSPRGRLVLGADGNFYGTTEFGGTASDGVTYRMTPAGATTILHSFTGPDGANSFAGLTLASDGRFYGTTSSQGGAGAGTLFSMTAAGSVAVVHSFIPADGGNTGAPVIQARDGALYGTTPSGGAATPFGSVFRQVIAGGPATATTRVPVNTGFFTEEDVVLTTPVGITALTLTITVQITPGLRFTGMYQTVFGQITQSHVTGPTTITYTFVLQPGNTIPPGTFTFAAQMGSNGVTHDVHGDSFALTYTAGGQSFTQTGTF
jgi:uncharacterized repeat protein (TIGR03803 family)